MGERDRDLARVSAYLDLKLRSMHRPYLQRLRERDGRIGCVNDTTSGRMCDIVGSGTCELRILAAPDAFGLPIACTTQELFSPPPAGLRANIIAASQGCFELASMHARAAGVRDVSLAPAMHEALHAADGQVLAHRGAWRTIAESRVVAIPTCELSPSLRPANHEGSQSVARSNLVPTGGQPSIVLEEDVHFIGDPTDVASAVARCERARCDLAYLGVSGDFFTSHA